jgi:hypothetical protein
MNKFLLIVLILVSASIIFPSRDTLQIKNKDATLIAEKLNSPIDIDGE